MALVDRDSGLNGGDRLNVRSGGSIRFFNGALMTPSSGTQASHVADRTAVAATAGSTTATTFNTVIASLASGQNAILAALRNVGVLATS